MARKASNLNLYLLIAVDGNRVHDTWLIESRKRNLTLLEAVKKVRSPFWQGEGQPWESSITKGMKKDEMTYDLVPIEPQLAMDID
jgi:hypothetical protein